MPTRFRCGSWTLNPKVREFWLDGYTYRDDGTVWCDGVKCGPGETERAKAELAQRMGITRPALPQPAAEAPSHLP
jgi:hypothetical protein